MSLFLKEGRRITLPAATLAVIALVLVVGGRNSSALTFSPLQQIPSPVPTAPGLVSTAQPTRPVQPTAVVQPTSAPLSTKTILLTNPVSDPKQQGVMWFAPTGHTLRGVFLDYWLKSGGLAQFGYPITEEFTEPGPDNNPLGVQYFERNRFEHHPENLPFGDVLLGLLGTAFHAPDSPASPITNARYFEDSGHNLSGAFKTYWETHGGLAIHGYPITEQFQETNPTDQKAYTVQYFERSRFELHPENAGTPHEVLLGLLGTQLSKEKGYPYGRYPQYGFANDYSWFAGYYKIDGSGGCLPCGCATVRFINPINTTYPGAEEIWPYLANQPRIRTLDVKGVEATLDPQTFIVVFGQLDYLNSMVTSKTNLSCLQPRFKVSSLQFNPAR